MFDFIFLQIRQPTSFHFFANKADHQFYNYMMYLWVESKLPKKAETISLEHFGDEKNEFSISLVGLWEEII